MTQLAIGIPGPKLSEQDRERLHRLQPAGVVLFQRNCASPQQMRELTGQLRGVLPRLWVGIDHEGGRVNRMPQQLPATPAARIMAQSPAAATEAHALAAGERLRELGIDINFAPVADLGVPGTHPSLLERTFGATPELVAEHCVAFAAGMRRAGVHCVAKHFPGLGSVPADTHQAAGGFAAAERFDDHLAPFRALIAAGVPGIMLAHATYPFLDQAPASLSAAAVALLADELGFGGTTYSDDMDMAAIAATYSVTDAVHHAVRAGLDVVCFCHDRERQEAAGRSLLDPDPHVNVARLWRRAVEPSRRRNERPPKTTSS